MLVRGRRLVIGAVVGGLAAGAVVAMVTGSSAGAVPGCVASPDEYHSMPTPVAGPAAAPLYVDGPAPGDIYYASIGGDRKTYVVRMNINEPDLLVGVLWCQGGGAVDTPAVTQTNAAIALYVLGPNGRIYQNRSTPGNPSIDPWTLVPGAPVGGGAPAVARRGLAGPIDMVVRGPDNQLYHASRGLLEFDTWSAWESLGGGLTGTPAISPSPDGTGLVVVIRAPNGNLYQRTGTTGAWGPWVKLGGATSASPTLATGFSAGRTDLFVTGTTGGLYQSTSTASGRWTPFKKVAADLPAAAKLAAAGSNGRMAVWATAREGAGTTVGLNRYVPGLGWSGFGPAPYTCATCLPDPVPPGAAATRRLPYHPDAAADSMFERAGR